MLGGFSFELKNVADIAAAAVVLALLLWFFIKRKSFRLMIIYVLMFLLYAAAVFADVYIGLPITRAIVTMLTIFMIVALLVVYQTDFKNMFFNLTKHSDKQSSAESNLSDDELRLTVEEILRACQTMSKSRTGALIVIAPTSVPSHILETGTELGALVSAPLLESIFNTKAPFHDGAVIVKGNRLLAAGCFLPLSESQTLAKNLGTRHRAGIGITEENDMLTIVVSEETGIISIAKKGALRRFLTSDRLRDILYETYNISQVKRARTI